MLFGIKIPSCVVFNIGHIEKFSSMVLELIDKYKAFEYNNLSNHLQYHRMVNA